jgi:hypothetical protein
MFDISLTPGDSAAFKVVARAMRYVVHVTAKPETLDPTCLLLPRCRNTFARHHPSPTEHLSANMSWRNQGITGSNNIPLGNRRRFGGDDEAGGYNPSAPAEGLSELKRGRSPERGKCNARHHYRRTLTNSLQLPMVPDSARSATDGEMLARTRPLVLWACLQLSTRP